MQYIKNKHIQEWILLGKILTLPVSISHQFSHYIDQLQWSVSGSHLDMSCFPHVSIDLSGITDKELIDISESFLIRKNSHIIFFYNASEPCLACERELGICNIDYMYSGAPGYRIMFGGSIDNGEMKVNFEHILQYDHMDSLTARI